MAKSRFMTSAERKALASPPEAASNLPKWNPRSGEAFNGYAHASKVGKGKKDGACNRTACQADLKGKPQFYMESAIHGRLYYCEPCARMFDEVDRKYAPDRPARCIRDRSPA